MGQGDRFTRRTRPFDSKRLAALSQKAELPEGDLAFEELSLDDAEPAPPEPSDDLERVTLSRATTVHDPLTTQLLAEVARRSQTMEVEPETADAAHDKADEKAETPAAQAMPRRKRDR
jgi:hypothetical protein